MASDVPQFTWFLYTNAEFTTSIPLTDADTGLAADPTGWSVRCEIKTARVGGKVVTRFKSDGSWDGDVTFDDDGNALFSLDSTITVNLPPTPRCPFDVVLTDPSGNPWLVAQGLAHIIQGVTTDA